MNQVHWHQLTLCSQLGNIGAEVGRSIKWRKQPRLGDASVAFFRALEYLDLTINDPRHRGARRHELCRLREVLVDWYFDSKLYHSHDSDWDRYFNPFAIRANRQLQAE